METWMMKILLVLMALLFPATESTFVDTYDWVSIDCGASITTIELSNMINWETDGDYIKTGKNSIVSGNNIAEQMKTLRSFPDGDKNCYSFAVDQLTKYLVRARFYYGNYDGLLKPPAFDILVNGFKWTTVVISSSEDPIAIEGIFFVGSYGLSICLARVRDDEVPFISSLEVSPLPYSSYSELRLFQGYLLQSRTNFGGKEDIGYTGNDLDDQHNRIWKAKGLQNYPNVSVPLPSVIDGYLENSPPHSALVDAIQAPRPSDSIIIPLNLTQIQQSVIVILYFVEVNESRTLNDIRKFQIEIGSQKNMSLVNITRYSSRTATLEVEKGNGTSTEIIISPVEGTTLPPLLNAMEVYTTMDLKSTVPATSLSGRVHAISLWFLLFMTVLCNMLPLL